MANEVIPRKVDQPLRKTNKINNIDFIRIKCIS